MTKRKGIFDVNFNINQLKDVSTPDKTEPTAPHQGKPIKEALDMVVRQMTVAGYRERTISDYALHVKHFQEVTCAKYLEDISAETIYSWLNAMNVAPQTKLTRLKCLKAFLSRCFDNRWLEVKFWKGVQVKVDQKVKEGATDEDISLLLSFLDLNGFIHLRDATAVLLMYRTGIRINTLSQIEEKHIDFKKLELRLDGSLLKNRQAIRLPLDKQLVDFLHVLIHQNEIIRGEYGKNNNLVFVNRFGDTIKTSETQNTVRRRLKGYEREYGIKNLNPHALRRGFAKNLLNKGAHITLISKALGHADLKTTTKYLHLDLEEVSNDLREFL